MDVANTAGRPSVRAGKMQAGAVCDESARPEGSLGCSDKKAFSWKLGTAEA